MFKYRYLLLALMMVSLWGCSDDDKLDTTTQIRVIHASPDAPKVDVLVDGSAALQAVDYAVGSGLIDLDAGMHDIEVQGVLPGDTRATVIGPVSLDLMAENRYDILAVNTVSAIEPLVISNMESDVTVGSVRAQVVHAAPAAPQVDVFVTAPGADLSMAAALGSFSFKENLGPVEIPADTYQIRVTLPGDPSTVVFDSGPVDLAAGSDLLLVAIANTNTGDHPVNILVMDGTGSSLIQDVNTPASLRVIHNSPDTPAVDIVVNDGFTAPLVEDLEFPDATDYVSVPADDYNVKVTAANNAAVIAIDADLTVDAGTFYSVYAKDFFSNVAPLVLTDDQRSVATEAKVRVIHGSPSAGPVDIYLSAPGDDIATLTPGFSNVPFDADTGYLSLAAGDYRVRVTPTGTQTVVIDTGSLSLAGGGIYTAIARDAAGGGLPVGLILLDDFL